MNRYKELTALTKELVRISSPYYKEHEVMQFVLDWFKKNGLPAERHSYHENNVIGFEGENVLCRISGKEKGTVLCLNGHLDTVPLTTGWTVDPYKGEIIDGKLYGLGSLDMKSGCAAIMIAARDFVKNNPNFNGEILITLVSDEEGPFGLGTNALIEEGLLNHIDCALVMEPSAGFVGKPFPILCLGAKGTVVYQVDFYGKASHAAIPEEGINAAVDAGKFVVEASKQQVIISGPQGKGRICPLSIEADGGACSVPEHARVVIHRHIVQGEDIESVFKEAEEIMSRANPDSRYEISMRPAPSEGSLYYKPYTLSDTNEYAQIMQQSIQDICGTMAETDYLASIGDFNYLGTRLNVPTVVIGPEGDNIHQSDEYVYIDTIEKTADILENFMGRLLLSDQQ